MSADGGGRIAADLLAGAQPLWEQIVSHPFIVATADGSLDRIAFDRWLTEDYSFVITFRRFLVELIDLAPDDAARDVLAGAMPPLEAEIALFQQEAVDRGLDLDGEPSLTTLGYTSYLLASLVDGYDVALTVLYGAEKAYFDAWQAVRARTRPDSAYWSFIENWSSDAFGTWVARLAELLDAGGVVEPTEPMRRAFDRTVRFELQFWDAVLNSDGHAP